MCGSLDNTKLTGCWNTGDVTGKNNVGGVCGKNNEGTIENCYNTAAVTGGRYVGGVCGANGSENDSKILNCYNTGNVSGNSGVGGVCGANGVGTIKDCYNAGEVSGNENVGAVCGNNSNTVTNCYYDTDICTVSDEKAKGVTTDKLCALDLGTVWNKGSVTSAVADSAGSRFGTAEYVLPSLKGVGSAQTVSGVKVYNFSIDSDDWQGYTLIENQTQLQDINNALEGNYVLKNSITLSGTFTPIGTFGSPFTGKFSGNGHVIKFKVSALVKFEGMADYSADATALTDKGGEFTISYTSGSNTVTAVSSTDIPDNTSVTAETASGVDLAGDQIPFTLTYDGTDSEYLVSGTKTCKLDIGRKTLTADDFDFAVPSDLTYDGSGKTATVTPKSTTTGVIDA